jgi:MFS family permease
VLTKPCTQIPCAIASSYLLWDPAVKIVLGTSILLVGSTSMIFLDAGPFMFFVGRLLVGVGCGFINSGGFTLLTLHIPKTMRGSAFGIAESGSGFGLFSGLVFGGLSTFNLPVIGYALPFVLSTILTLCLFLVLLYNLQDMRADAQEKPPSFTLFLGNFPLVLLLMCIALQHITVSVIDIEISVVLTALDPTSTPASVASVVVVCVFSYAICATVTGKIADKLDSNEWRIGILGGSMIVLGMQCLILAHIQDTKLAYLISVLWGGSLGAAYCQSVIWLSLIGSVSFSEQAYGIGALADIAVMIGFILGPVTVSAFDSAGVSFRGALTAVGVFAFGATIILTASLAHRGAPRGTTAPIRLYCIDSSTASAFNFL